MRRLAKSEGVLPRLSLSWGLVVVLVGLLVAEEARADPRPCATVTADQATKAANTLTRGAKYFDYCAGCARPMGPWKTVDEVAIVGSGAAPRQLRLNGAAVAAGAIYYLATDGQAHNLGARIGCPVEGYPAAIPVDAPTPVGSRRYQLGLRVDVLSSKADGWAWDVGSTADPVLRGGLYRGKELVRALSCTQQDTLVSTCLSGTIVDADEGLSLILDVKDKDPADDDDIGTLSVPLRDAIKNAGRAINVRTRGQIKRATLSLTPVE